MNVKLCVLVSDKVFRSKKKKKMKEFFSLKMESCHLHLKNFPFSRMYKRRKIFVLGFSEDSRQTGNIRRHDRFFSREHTWSLARHTCCVTQRATFKLKTPSGSHAWILEMVINVQEMALCSLENVLPVQYADINCEGSLIICQLMMRERRR